MTFGVETFSSGSYARDAARHVAGRLPEQGTVVVTGGTTAADVYRALAGTGSDWAGIDVFFSDERCVPPDDDASNFGMAKRTLFDDVGPRTVHRMRGEDAPEPAAETYHRELMAAETRSLVLLGMGADAHIAALFPGSGGLEETTMLCIPVDRPDGLTGLTLTPPALLDADEIVLIVSGESKAEAVKRAVTGDQPVAQCPARLLGDHANVTFLLDEAAASLL